jgi:predicted HTH transcriptional regulator
VSADEDLVAAARAAIADLARRIREKSDVELVLTFAQFERPTEALRDELVEKATKKKPRPARKPKRAPRVVPPLVAESSEPEEEAATSSSRPTRAPEKEDESRRAKIVAHLQKIGRPLAPHEIAHALRQSKWRMRRDLQVLAESAKIAAQGNKRGLRYSAA